MKNVYTVAQVNSYIKNMFSQDFMMNSIYIKGEVSNLKYHSSGHIYFTLKDDKAVMACVMFAGYSAGLKFRLQQGQQVIAGGSVEVYERDGKYQLYVKEMMLEGAGLLYEKLEKMKQELKERGMFAPEYKQKLPRYIKRLGIVTAPTGAAVQDIINISLRRNPYLQIILYPAIVQGDMAPASIVNGIHALEQIGVDVMIVGRGGGSLEDLWAFNEEIVAQAIFDSSIPVISAVGHETDTTIADYVADLRAATPSAAAELAVCEIRLLLEQIDNYERILGRQMQRKIDYLRQEMRNRQMRLQFVSPTNQIKEKRTYAMKLEENLFEKQRRILQKKRHRLELYIEQIKGMSPLEKLNQGFSFTSSLEGKTINSVTKVKSGEMIRVQVKDGQIIAQVQETHNISGN